ncbi:MAG: PD40 domain-containing protein [Bryobacterales bacterium]|nr:PD40 domain-containing protein [Bryobacterales bacterium]
MTTEQWRRVQHLFGLGIDLPEPEREPLLLRECSDDLDVAQEVRRLWRTLDEDFSLLDRPMVQLPVTGRGSRQMLEPGHVVDRRFTVLKLVGSGGMGEVYRARDERLGRIVALKVLAGRVAGLPEYRVRLEREARAVSALGHPRICALHDFGTDGDMTYLVMEFVAGQSLSARIAAGPLPLLEVLSTGSQIAEALDAAHRAGIVHRDLKPANVMLTDAGVKLLDFGIAKKTPATLGGFEKQITITTEGQIVGTVAYMSPEQAEGKPVDVRSDVFTLGSILYEMTTGRRAFAGDSSLSTLAAILHQEPPPVQKLLPAAPPKLDALIRRCLKKRPEDRTISAAEVKAALDDLQYQVATRRVGWRIAAFAVTTAAVIAVAALAWSIYRKGRLGDQLEPPSRLTMEAGNARYPAISHDGKLLAYASDRNGNFDIYLRQIGGTSEVRLTSSTYNEAAPTFTPDGRHIVFQSDEMNAGLQVVPTLGGERRILAAKGFGPRVSPDGRQVLYWTAPWTTDDVFGPDCRLMLVPFTGGDPRVIRSDFRSAAYPLWLQDGRHILYVGYLKLSDPTFEWWISTLDDTPAQPTLANAAISRLGKLGSTPTPLFEHNGLVYGKATIDDTNSLVAVQVELKGQGVEPRASRVITNMDSIDSAAASSDGSLIYSVTRMNDDLYRLKFDPRTHLSIGDPEQLTFEPSLEHIGALTHDSKLLAYASNRTGTHGIWVKNLETGDQRKVADTLWSLAGRLTLSPDGRLVAFLGHEQRDHLDQSVKTVPTSGGASIMLPHSRNCVPLTWRDPRTIRLQCFSDQANQVRIVELAFPSGHILSQSQWAPLDRFCLPSIQLERCYATSGSNVTFWARPIGTHTGPSDPIAVVDLSSAVNMIGDDDTVVYWGARGETGDSLLGRMLDVATGRPKGPAFVAYRVRGSARLAPELTQQNELHNGSAVLTIRSSNSNLWRQQLPE